MTEQMTAIRYQPTYHCRGMNVCTVGQQFFDQSRVAVRGCLNEWRRPVLEPAGSRQS
jgi:hypothetical protein